MFSKNIVLLFKQQKLIIRTVDNCIICFKVMIQISWQSYNIFKGFFSTTFVNFLRMEYEIDK